MFAFFFLAPCLQSRVEGYVLHSADRERVGEALPITLVTHAAAMLSDPKLDGVLFQYGGIQLGSMFAVLVALVALLALSCEARSREGVRIDRLFRPGPLSAITRGRCGPGVFTFDRFLSNAVIAPLVSACATGLFLLLLMLGPASHLSFVPLRTDVSCVLVLFLGFPSAAPR